MAQPKTKQRLRERWLSLLADSRTQLDGLTVAAHLGVLTAGWLAELPVELADSWETGRAARGLAGPSVVAARLAPCATTRARRWLSRSYG